MDSLALIQKRYRLVLGLCVVFTAGQSELSAGMDGLLFAGAPSHDTWVEFRAQGFEVPVTGYVYGGENPAADGLPLGGIETGCLDIETNGLLGYCTLFNSFVPRRGPLNEPFLGISIGKQTWLLSTCGIAGINSAKAIRYWGHYPVADIEYELDAPVQIGVRAWSPFIPGDVHASDIPAAIFEVHLRNMHSDPQNGAVAFSFPGFERSEVRYAGIKREPVDGSLKGILATGGGVSYAIGVLGEGPVRTGGGLAWDSSKWKGIAAALPPYPKPDDHDNSACSVSTDFSLKGGEERTVRFVLAWHAPEWKGNGTPSSGGNPFTHKYAEQFKSLEDTLTAVASGHESLLKRVLAWQGVIYAEKAIPGWLQDTLINSLHLITETAHWAQAKPPVGDWCRPEDGIFGMNECPRSCPQIECIPCTFYGNIPIVYFFPELALSTLRAYKAYQFPNGRPAWIHGSGSEMASPTEGYQYALNGSCYAEIFNKLWLCRDKDEALLAEFYDSLKKATIFTMTLRPAYGDRQVISMPEGNAGQEWFESTQFYGMCAHVGGVHLAHLQMALEWAARMKDEPFRKQCEDWLRGGSRELEDNLWADTHYLLYSEPESGHKSDVVMGYQLDGDWISRLHGYTGVFRDERSKKTLETIKKINADPVFSPNGAVVFAASGGGQVKDFNTGYWTPTGLHLPSVLMVGMTYMMHGDRDFGLSLCERAMRNVMCKQHSGWDWGILYDAVTGERVYGNDYYQDLVIWSIPAVLMNQNLSSPTNPGGLVERILKAGGK